jgi:hypothetical protein
MVLGATAALAFLAVFTPTTGASLVVNALIAGSTATAVFRLLQGRMLAKPVAKTEREPGPAKLSLVGGTQATAAQ